MNPFFRLLVLLAAFAAQGVFAQSIGRTEVKDLPEGWRQLTTYELKGLSLNSGTKHIPMQGGAFVSGSGNMLLVVESTTGGNSMGVNWLTMKCPASRENYFTNDYGANQSARDTRCLVVNARYSDKKYLEGVSPQAASAVEKENLKFEKGQLIRAWSGLSGGTYLKVYLFKNSPFKTASGANASEQELVALGESLQKAVYDSTLSLGGGLSLQLLNTIK
jgi:hypothetical protein